MTDDTDDTDVTTLAPRDCARRLFDELEGHVRLALPLGLGKASSLANALYAEASVAPGRRLDIFTALTLEIPAGASDVEKRFLDPVVDRLYARVPVLDYASDLRAGALPDNVTVTEFFFAPGAWMSSPAAQQNYTSINYTHAARDLAALGVNVMAQLVATESDDDGEVRFSLGANPDVTLDLLDLGRDRIRLVGERSEAMPFMEGDAVVPADAFEAIVEPEAQCDLFPVPNEPVDLAGHAIAIRAAALVEDGGTLQIGIGGLGDAVAHAIALRHRRADAFAALADAIGADGNVSPFGEGLYGCSEMMVEGFLALREAGVLTRTVRDGVCLDGGFFVGSRQFYDRLRAMARNERDTIRMRRISFTNALEGGDESQKRDDRCRARFMNTAMMVTLGGAVVSDGLEDGRVVSGVGGQFNFVVMGHELAGGRAVIMLPATRMSGGKVTSNIRWSYGHTTIPRHLRDIVVTEYGVADLRGASDADVAARLLAIADSRFQDELRERAVEAGKLPEDWEIPASARENTPERLAGRFEASGEIASLPHFPLGTDFTETESALAVALDALSGESRHFDMLARVFRGRRHANDERLQPALERMGLASPKGVGEHALRALVASALHDAVISCPRPLTGPGY